MRILITGHKGFIGGYLYKELSKEHEVFGIDLKDGQDILYSHLPDVDLVYHLAAQADVIKSVDNPLLDARQNIMTIIKIIERYPNTKIIFSSSGGAIQNENAESPYGLAKITCEKYLKLLHKNYIICRFPNVFGEGSHSVIEKFLEQPECNCYNAGLNTRDYVHVSDIIKGLILSQKWEKGIYQMGSEKEVMTLDIARATRKKINVLNKIPGELVNSVVKNTTPNWKPTINPIEYVHSNLHNSI